MGFSFTKHGLEKQISICFCYCKDVGLSEVVLEMESVEVDEAYHSNNLLVPVKLVHNVSTAILSSIELNFVHANLS